MSSLRDFYAIQRWANFGIWVPVKALHLTCCIAREPKELESNSLIAGGARNPKVSSKSADLD
jgi:hypothetical protein